MSTKTEPLMILYGTQVEALKIALDELDCYVGVMGEDADAPQHEANLGRLRWASKKLHALLATH